MPQIPEFALHFPLELVCSYDDCDYSLLIGTEMSDDQGWPLAGVGFAGIVVEHHELSEHHELAPGILCKHCGLRCDRIEESHQFCKNIYDWSEGRGPVHGKIQKAASRGD